MNLINLYVQKKNQDILNTQAMTPVTWEDSSIAKSVSGVASNSKQRLSSLEITPKSRYELLAFLMNNTPSAAQCVTKICESVLSDGLHIVPAKKGNRLNKNQKKELEEKFKQWNIVALLEAFIRQHQTFGDAWLYPVPSLDGSTVADLVVLDAGRVTIRVDKALLEESGIYKPVLVDYKLRNSGVSNASSAEGIVEYEIDKLIRMRRPNVNHAVYGLAPLEEEQATLLLGVRILNHNLRFFQNLGKPPLIIKLNENTNKKQAEEYKEYFEQNYKGPNKVWETMISYGGTEFQELDLPDQTAFMDMLTFVRVQVCGLFGVPPIEVGVADKSGLNSTETQHKDFIKTNINRKKLQIQQLLNEQLLPRMGITDWQIYVPPMDAVSEKQRIELNALALASGQMTINEARKTNTYQLIEEEWADELLVGDPKGVKGFHLMDDMMDGTVAAEESADGKTSDADPNKAGGRADLEGRAKEPNESANAE